MKVKGIFTSFCCLLLIGVKSVKQRSAREISNEEHDFVQTESSLDLDSEAMNGVRLVLKRRQKYLYDYFFPKNMRDHVEDQRLEMAAKNMTLAETNKLQKVRHQHLNQCELNKNGE